MNDNMTRAETDTAIEKTPGERVTQGHLENIIVARQFVYPEGTSLTICILTLRNGFTVTGESACVDPRNYDRNIGNSIAHRHAFEKLWLLEGYALAERRHAARTLVEAFGCYPGDMHLYTGTKALAAKPMTLGDYNELRGWTIPENEDPARAGYYVMYFDDYVSWSPADVFEAAYTRYRD